MDILNEAFKAHGDLKQLFYRALSNPAKPPSDTEQTVRRYLESVKAEEFITIENGLVTRPSFHQCIAAHLPYHIDNCHRAVAVENSKYDRWQWFITFFTKNGYHNGGTLHFDLMLHRPWMIQLLNYCGNELSDDDPRVVADRFIEGEYDYC